MDNPIPENQDALIQEIHDAFRDVNREGGVSWNEAYVLDMYGSMDERLEARRSDKDKTWQELIHAEWNEHPGVGGWAFWDAIGFRYYLAPTMIRALRNGHSGLAFWLTPSERHREYSIQQWSLLNERQVQCLKSFMNYMICLENGDFCCQFEEARDNYWDGVA